MWFIEEYHCCTSDPGELILNSLLFGHEFLPDGKLTKQIQWQIGNPNKEQENLNDKLVNKMYYFITMPLDLLWKSIHWIDWLGKPHFVSIDGISLVLYIYMAKSTCSKSSGLFCYWSHRTYLTTCKKYCISYKPL